MGIGRVIGMAGAVVLDARTISARLVLAPFLGPSLCVVNLAGASSTGGEHPLPCRARS